MKKGAFLRWMAAAVIIGITGGATFAQEAEPASIDVARLTGGKFKDKIIILNKTEEEVSARVFCKASAEWIFTADTQSLKMFDDEYVVKARAVPVKAKDLAEVGIEATDGKEHEYKAYIRNQDLYVEIREVGTDLKKAIIPSYPNDKAFLFDRNYISGNFDENIKIKNQTSLKGLSVTVSVYDPKIKEWKKFGSATVNKRGDVTTVRSKLDLEDYRYFAAETFDGEEYNFMPVEDDSDLIINVSL